MSNKRNLQEQDIINLLKQVKQVDPPYPRALQDKRRFAFLALIPALHLIKPPTHGGSGASTGGGASSGGGGVSAANLPMTFGMKAVLGVLTTTIMALGTYAGSMIYQNWDALVDYFKNDTPALVQPSPYPLPNEQRTATPMPTGTLIPTGTSTPTGTLVPSLTPLPPATSTDAPKISTTPPPPTDSGNHYGQTKTPRPKPTKKP